MQACRYMYEFMKVHQHNAGQLAKIAAMPIYGKHFRILFPGTTGPIVMKLCMTHQRPKLFLDCSNHYPGLTYLTARSNFATWAFMLENVTVMDYLKIIVSSNLEFC